MGFCQLMKKIDFFGKVPEFYLKGKTKQVSWFGRIFTYIFIILYIVIFCYKVIRMYQRVDITFYDSDADVWRQKFNQIKSYLDTHGGNWLPIDLQAEDGTYFRSWIKYSRRRYADGKLTPEKRQLLESIHIMIPDIFLFNKLSFILF